MKIIIAGNGKVGASLVRQLAEEGHDLTVIDEKPSVLETSIERYDVLAIQGNCAAMSTLEQAGMAEADLLIAATGSDELNLLCCMTAHAMNPSLHTIGRLRNPEYSEQIHVMRDAFALSLTVNPERQTAMEIERLLKYPGFLKRDSFINGRIEIVELRVEADSKLCNVALRGLSSVLKCRVLVCAVLRDGMSVAPDGDFVLRERDRVFVTAPTEDLATLMKNLGLLKRRVSRVVLIGGGRVSIYLARNLVQGGLSVTLIERDADRCRQLAEQLPGVDIVHGDASSHDVLEGEGIDRCDALVALTGLDELNMIVSLYARSRGVGQVITKLSREENVEILNSLELGGTVCPAALCSDTIVSYVRAMGNQTGAAVAVHKIADEQAEAMEFVVDETIPYCGVPLKDIALRKNVLIVGISHAGRTEIPNGASCFNNGDSLVIVSTGETVIRQLSDIFA